MCLQGHCGVRTHLSMFFPWQELSARQTSDIMLWTRRRFSTVCVTVCVCVCGREGGRWLLSWLMDWTAVSYWALKTGMITQRNVVEGFAGRNEQMTGGGENSSKTRKRISTNHQRRLKTTGRKDVKRQDARRSSVFTLSILSVRVSSIVFISDTARNSSMTHCPLKCYEPGFAGRGGDG